MQQQQKEKRDELFGPGRVSQLQERLQETNETAATATAGGGFDRGEYTKGLSAAGESISIGREVLSSLAGQQESLSRSEMMAESTEYVVDKSRHVLRGMTFLGRIQNLFIAEPSAEKPPPPPPQQNSTSSRRAGAEGGAQGGGGEGEGEGVAGFICPECRRICASAEDLMGHHSAEHQDQGQQQRQCTQDECSYRPPQQQQHYAQGGSSGGSAVPTPVPLSSSGLAGGRNRAGLSQTRQQQLAVMESQQQYLDTLLPAVAELKGIGDVINHSLDKQHDTVDRMGDRMETVADKTAFIARRTHRLVKSTAKAELLGRVGLQEVSTGLFLSVDGEDVVLVGKDARNTCWLDVHSRNGSTGGIYGLRAVLSGLWVGQTLFGSIKAKGRGFKKWEEWQADFHKDSTKLLSCSADFGKGGYVKIGKPFPFDSSSFPEGGGGGGDGGTGDFSADGSGRGPAGFSLEIGKATRQDKATAATFRIVRAEDYHTSPFASAVLPRRAQPPQESEYDAPPGVRRQQQGQQSSAAAEGALW